MDASYLMRIIELAGGGANAAEGKWLRAYDPDANDGRGHLQVTPDKEHAMRFANAAEAAELWRRQSRTQPLRPDGKPNRPLTAFTVEFVKE